MDEIIGNDEISSQYAEYIWVVWNKIRNKTAHESIHPNAQYVLREESHVIYDVKKAIGDYDKDTAALDALIYSVGDIARYLLFDKLFDLKVFPVIRPLHSKRIVSSNNKGDVVAG